MANSCAACKHAKPVHYSRTDVKDPRCTHPDLVMYGQLVDRGPFTRFYLMQREARSPANACGPDATLHTPR